MVIRRALPEDAPAAQAVVHAGFETFRAFAPPGWEPPDETRPEELERSRAELADPRTFALVAEDAGRVVGHVRWIPCRTASPDGSMPDVHFRHLFVLPEHWGTGLARELHRRAVAEIRGTARLHTPALQARARRFYEREGWSRHLGPFPVEALGLDVVEYRLTGRSM